MNAGSLDAPRVRVCHLLPTLRHGGAESQVLFHLEAADRERFELHLCLMKDGDPALEARAEAVVSGVERLRFRWRTSLTAAVRLRAYLRRHGIEVLHCHLPLADTFGRLVGMASGVEVLVTTEHGKHLWKRPPHLLLDRLLNHRTAARICVSEDIARIRREREGLSVRKSPVIPNAVDLDALRRPRRTRAEVLAEWGWPETTEFLLAVGRLVDAKNYPLLLDTMALLRDRRPAARAVIAGGGPLERDLRTQVDRRGLGEVLRLAGPRDDVPDLLHAADVYVLSSRREGLPVAMLEAMACARPVVATPAGGVTEVLRDGVNGVAVPHDDPEALASAVVSLLDDRARAESLGRRAAQDIESGYDIRATLRRTEAIYLRALGREAGPRPQEGTAC